jgi:glycine dehydrogenase
MLEYVGSNTIEQLISETIPENIRLKKEMNLKPALSENEYLSHIEKLGKKK